MIYFDVLPAATLQSFLVAPPPPPPPRLRRPRRWREGVKVIPRQSDAGKVDGAETIPKEIAQIREMSFRLLDRRRVVGGVAGMTGGSVGGVLAAYRWCTFGRASASASAQDGDSAAHPRGRNVQAANLITQIKPVYPPLAKQGPYSGDGGMKCHHRQGRPGTGSEGVRGHPLLVHSAMDAVKGWIYRPTMLNGEPVEVSTTIDVNFTLQ